MSDIEYFGKVSPQPFISLRKEEGIKIEEIKIRLLKKESMGLLLQEQKSESELTYERDVKEDY